MEGEYHKHPLAMLKRFNNQLAKKKQKAKQKAENDVLGGQWKAVFKSHKSSKRKPGITLWDAVQRYSETILSPTRTPKRFRQERNQMLRVIDYWGKERDVATISESDLSEYRDYLLNRGLKPNSANRYLITIQHLLRICEEEWEVIARAPRIRQLSEPPPKMRYLTEQEEKRLLAASPIHLQRLILFLLGTGCRLGEALGLKWGHVDLVPDSRGKIRIFETKNGHAHSIPLPNTVQDMLITMKTETAHVLPWVFSWNPTKDRRDRNGDVIYRKGIPTRYAWPHFQFNIARNKSGIKDVTLHTMRHTYATRLIMKGVPLYDVSRLLNHKTMETTLRYSHLTPGFMESAVAALDVQKTSQLKSPSIQSRYEGML